MASSPLRRLSEEGQSPWLDFIQRGLIRSGELAGMIDRWGLRGVTSNPVIFEKAIVHSGDYDDEVGELARAGHGADGIYEQLAIGDVGGAADVFRPVYEEAEGADGFVSLEVSPRLAHDTEATVEEGRRLWAALGRPNVMIKVPATPAGLPAIRRLLAEGVNVNITLLFGLERYGEVVEAFLSGLEDRAARGLPVERVASVASFFLSRIDTLLDPELDKRAAQGDERAKRLRGEVAIASAKRAYALFQERFGAPRWRALAERGAQPQRLLWASTGTKDPAYSDVKYVEPLIGPHTVNTMPLETLEAYDDHGRPAARLAEGMDESAHMLRQLAEVGIDLQAATEQLVAEGVEKFVVPFDRLLESVEGKRREALGEG